MKSAAVKALLIASLRTADPIGTSRRVVAGLAIHAKAGADKLQPFRKAMAADTAPLGEALWEAIQTTDPVAMRAGLRKIARRMGDFTTGTALGELLATESAKAFVKGATPKNR